MQISTDLQRSQLMSRIKGRNTKPEVLLRKGLFALGFRYRIHDRALPGRPDIVFKSRGAAIFFNGCFWHGHSCQLFRWPKTNRAFWRKKIRGNISRDRRNTDLLIERGWRVLIVWECSIRGKSGRRIGSVVEDCALWLSSSHVLSEVSDRLRHILR